MGLNGFSNPMRDPKTEEFKENIGQGVNVKFDESGNILLKQLSKSPVYVKNTPEDRWKQDKEKDDQIFSPVLWVTTW